MAKNLIQGRTITANQIKQLIMQSNSQKNNQIKVAILLGTFNGERFLEKQLSSYLSQTHKNWKLYVSDDFSTDDTLGIINKFQKGWGENKIEMSNGLGLGYPKNFISLIKKTEGKADYFAFSDQDDEWKPEKLEKAINFLATQNPNLPALYCSRTEYISEDDQFLGLSKDFNRSPSFQNALVQCIAGANTMVMNKAASDLLSTTPEDIDLVSHDWWAYQLITGHEGVVYFDHWPSVKYRQHPANRVGQNRSLRAKFYRASLLCNGTFKKSNKKNINAINRYRDSISSENLQCLDHFLAISQANIFKRIIYLAKSKVYRQRFYENVALVIAALLGKV